jgi:hypothetical protein
MKKSLPYFPASTIVLAAATALAQTAEPVSNLPAAMASVAAAADESDSVVAPGDRLLLQAATNLERRASISARLRHQLSIESTQHYGAGSYWQQGSGDELKVRLELQLAGQDARLLQVSDNRFLWIDRRLPTGRSVTRIDLRQLRADPLLTASNLDDIQPGDAKWSPLHPGLIAHSGGLPSLLASLGENFSFMPPQAMRLAVTPTAASQPTSVPVFAVVGHWKRERLLALLDGDKSDTSETNRDDLDLAEMTRSLPPRFPQEILLLVSQSDLFPCRLEYRRLQTPFASGDAALAIPYQLSADPMIVMEFSDVVYDAMIPAGQFDYMPGDADWMDQTAVVLEKLRRERQAQVANREGMGGASLPAR